MRWLLASLATALFLVSMVETRDDRLRTQGRRVGKHTPASRGTVIKDARIPEREGSTLEVATHLPTVTSADDQVKIRQLASHRTDYVSTVSHELRTPLTSIRGFAQLITRGELSPSVIQTYAGTIVDEADRLSRIVDDVVALTRMESALLTLRSGVVSVSELVTRLIQRLQTEREPIRLELVVEGELPRVRGDQSELSQAFAKLVVAAIDNSIPTARVRLLARSDSRTVNIRIAYTTTPAQLARIKHGIEDLWQCDADGLATRLGRGSIDLYVARNVIEAHGGTVGVEEGDGGDASIWVSLPAIQGD